MNTFIKSLLVFLIFLCSLQSRAVDYDFKVGGIYYLIRDSINEMTVYATSNLKSSKDIYTLATIWDTIGTA